MNGLNCTFHIRNVNEWVCLYVKCRRFDKITRTAFDNLNEIQLQNIILAQVVNNIHVELKNEIRPLVITFLFIDWKSIKIK